MINESRLPFVARRLVPFKQRFQGEHHHHIISLTFSGGSEYSLKSGKSQIRQGDLLYFEPKAWQSWRVNDPRGWDVMWIVVDLPPSSQKWLPKISMPDGMLQLHVEGVIFDEIKHSFERMLLWNNRFSVLSSDIVLNQINYIFLLTCEDSLSVEIDPRVQKAVQFLRNNLHQPIALKDIESAAHLSRARLSALFKSEMGVTQMQFLENIRMEKASQMLLFTADNIDVIAGLLGYQDRKYFDKRFKRHWRKTPYAFRQNRPKSLSSIERPS